MEMFHGSMGMLLACFWLTLCLSERNCGSCHDTVKTDAERHQLTWVHTTHGLGDVSLCRQGLHRISIGTVLLFPSPYSSESVTVDVTRLRLVAFRLSIPRRGGITSLESPENKNKACKAETESDLCPVYWQLL